MSENDPPDEPTGPPEPPPPNPYGASPYGAPDPGSGAPGSYPAFPASGGQNWGQPQRKDTWKIWLGIGLAIPALIATGIVVGGLGVIDGSGALSVLAGLAGLVAPIVMLFFASTRKLAVGLLIGYAALFILAAGACVVLIASFDSSYG